MKTSSSWCKSISPSTQVKILNDLDSVVFQVNEKFASNIQLVELETFFSDHLLYISVTSDVIYGCVLDSFLMRIELLLSRFNVFCFGRPKIHNIDFINKVVNLVAEFD